MELPEEEPSFEPTRTVPTEQFAAELLDRLPRVFGRPAVVAVDGRSGSGKSTVARRLAALLDGAVVVGTDDLAWHHSFFGWADLLVDHVLVAVHEGRAVELRPPAWDVRGRTGAVTVPAGTRIVIVEGVGAARHEAAALVDVVIWVQSDFEQAKRRCLTRDRDDPGAEAFWHEWMACELPFLAADRPWERADVVIVNDDDRAVGPDIEVATTGWRGPRAT